MMQRVNAILVEEIKALQYATALRNGLAEALEETSGGNFLSVQTRDRVQELLRSRVIPSR